MFKPSDLKVRRGMMKRISNGAIGLLGLALAACGGADETATPPETAPGGSETRSAETNRADSEARPVAGSLEWAATGVWRPSDDIARNAARHPVETLTFFGIEPDHTVIEIWPGGGWYTKVLAPYLAAGGGQLIAAGWDAEAAEGERRARIEAAMEEYAASLAGNPDLYGDVDITVFSGRSGPLTADGSADAVLTFRNIHSMMGQGLLDKLMADAFAALKPGGTLGVVQHRLPSTMEQDPAASTGYVHEDVVKAAAAEAGFEFVESSEINANPADTADHPFGVWTLPPVSRTSDREGNTPEDFDPDTYAAIGESDRMTLKFRKPAQ